MRMFIDILFVLITFFPVSSCQYDLSGVIPGIKMSVNDDMFVSVSNAFANFAVIMHPFRNATAGGPIRCNMRYNTTNRLVYSVAVVGIAKNTTDAEHFIFIFAVETISDLSPKVCIGIISKSTCINTVQCMDVGLAGIHQEYFLIKVDSNGNYAYGFSNTFAIKLDIYANRILLNLTTNAIWPLQNFIPHAIDVADTWAVVAGYGYGDEIKSNYAALVCYIDLFVMINASCTNFISETTYLIPANVMLYNTLYDLSVSIRGRKVLVGVHRLSSVVILENIESSLNITQVHKLIYSDVTSFGRVVDWADDTTIAVLVENPDAIPWSKSQIYFYDENLVTLTTPIFTFPNNQQILGYRLSSPSFARFGITNRGNMAILTSNGDVLVIPLSPAGHTSTWIDTTERAFVFYFKPKLCIGGTYKNRSDLGPCQICPPRTRNPGTFPGAILQCIPCSNDTTTFCPLGSLVEVNSNKIASNSQAVAYPETGDTTDFGDLLLKNMFQMKYNPRCLAISPILWTLVVSGLCFLVLLFMMIIKLCKCQQWINCRRKMKKIFRHTDFIGEGQRWISGLATVAAFVLIGFSYWFSISYLQRYPIENLVKPATFACDQTLINAQFTTGLVLLDIPKSNESQFIFNLLDSQIFYLTLELINTGFSCDSTITAQENLAYGKNVPLLMNCARSVSDAMTSIILPFPRHQSTVQITMDGPHWIGGIRLCIRGNGQIDKSNTLRKLDFCRFYSTPNETIGRNIQIPIVFVKNINMTYGLSETDPTLYSGLWIPTFSAATLSDESYYAEFGNYLRYKSSIMNIQIVLDERPFFVKNIQRPIVRTAELIFKDLLFTFLCIEIFAFYFLLMKLFIIPLCGQCVNLWQKYRKRNGKFDLLNRSYKSTSNSNSLANENLLWRVSIEPTTSNTSDASVRNRSTKDKRDEYSISNINSNESQLTTKF